MTHTTQYAVVLNPGEDCERIDSTHATYAEAVDAANRREDDGNDVDVMKYRDGRLTTEF